MLGVCLECSGNSFCWVVHVLYWDSLQDRDEKTGCDIHQVLKCVSVTRHVRSCAILIPTLPTRQCCVSAIEGMKLTGWSLPKLQVKAQSSTENETSSSRKHIHSSQCFHYMEVIDYLLWATHSFRTIDSTLNTTLICLSKAYISSREWLR